MGFFDLKVTCVCCNNKEVGLNRYKIKDGWLCPSCMKTYKDGFRTSRTIAEIIQNSKNDPSKIITQETNQSTNQTNVAEPKKEETKDISLNSIQKLQFKKFISEQSGMSIAEVDSYLSSITVEENEELILSFKNQEKTNTVQETPAPTNTTTTVNIVQENNNPRCPKCKSRETTYNKQGFGVGKAAVGAILTGGIGLLAGGINKNKIIITCLKCGHSWTAG